MYQQHFSLSEMPFSLTPDTQFFLGQQSHRNALNTMLVALRHSEGFIKVVGEVGTGKTLLCRKLLDALGEQVITAYIPNPYLTPLELKGLVAREIGADFDESMPADQALLALNHRLLELAADNRHVVLVIDEAQAMPRETIEALRLLTNLETPKRKLLQVVLFGQPELDQLLARDDLRQLKQRIVFNENLKPFSVQGAVSYLRHRLIAAGAERDVFSSGALLLLAKASGGIPRLLNILAHKAMISAYGRGEFQVRWVDVTRAVLDTEQSSTVGHWLAKPDRWLWPSVGAASAVFTLWLQGVGVFA